MSWPISMASPAGTAMKRWKVPMFPYSRRAVRIPSCTASATSVASPGERIRWGYTPGRMTTLRHFGRRQKAFEGGGEDGMGFGRAAGQLIEFRQRQCGAQFKTARCLTLGDVGSGQESLFCRGRIAGVAPQQDIAADAMQLCFERAKILFGRM